MRLLIIDKTATLKSFRKKWAKLAVYPDVELHLLVPNRWKENYIEYRYQKGDDEPMHIYAGAVLFPGYGNRSIYFYSIFHVFRTVMPDVILLMEEPFSFFAMETIIARSLFAPSAPLIFFAWDNLSYNYAHVYRPPCVYTFIEKITLKRSNAALCANTEAKKVLQSKQFKNPIHVIYYGINLALFRQEEGLRIHKEGTVKDTFVIGYVGRMLQQKGLDVLLGAFSKLPADTRMLLAGSGPYLSKILDDAGSLGVLHRIEHLPSLNPEDIPGVMKRLDVLVLPSLTTRIWKEQFGRVLVEAMAAGCPVIGSDSGAIPEIIGDAGMIVPEGNSDELYAALLEMKENHELRNRLSGMAMERAERFSEEKFIKKIYVICLQLINDRTTMKAQ